LTLTKTLKKIFFKLNAGEWHGNGTESVWAELISANRYRIRNTPFFAKGVSFEDIVFVYEKGGDLLFESTSISAGHSTYRILLDKSISNNNYLKYWKPLEQLGCSYESTTIGEMLLLAVDVPSKLDIHHVYDLFDKGAKQGVWDFEEGHCGHSL